MKKNMQEKVTRWSIRRLSVGVASVVVASGFFMITSPANSVLAKEGNVTPVTQTTQNKVDKEKESKSDDVNKLIKNAVDTVLTNSNDSSTSPQATESTTNKPIENKVEDRAATPAAETRTNSETPATIEETKPEQVKVAVQNNVKESIDVPAAYLEKAEGVGPFTAGVNQVIPYEFFAGDGMLTRLLLKTSDKAPWSDNGTAKNPALSPLGENMTTKGQYFYEVDLNGNTVGKQGQALIDQLRANGTQTYKATVKVYGNKDGKADLTNLVATKDVNININGVVSKETVQKAVQDNVKENIDVPAAYLEKAEGVGPFTAGVNQVIPYEFFAGDGMLTRLLLKASDKAPWSDNGTAKNPALSPLGENVNTKGQYFYEVDLNGNTKGKQGQDLIDQLRDNGTQTYKATVKVYGNKDGKADLMNLVATKNINITINGLVAKETVQQAVENNVKPFIDVPASYLKKAKGDGPFTAGVNQVIPYEFFAGDGMLTRLLLKASDKAPWSDNGTAKNPALSPLGENINTKGQYFYEVDLNGNTTGKEGQALLDLLRANGDHTYDATVKVYGNKDGKADLSNVIAERKVKIHLNKVLAPATTPSSSTNTTQEMNKMSTPKEDMMAKENTSKQEVKSTMKENLNKAKEEMKSPMMAHQKTTSQDMMKKDNMSTLPETGETATNTAALGAFSAAFAFILGTLGLKAKKERN